MKDWLKENWRAAAGWTCAVGSAALALTPYAAAAAVTAPLCAKLFADDAKAKRAQELANPAVRALRDAHAAATGRKAK